jgi:hypothetical protein
MLNAICFSAEKWVTMRSDAQHGRILHTAFKHTGFRPTLSGLNTCCTPCGDSGSLAEIHRRYVFCALQETSGWAGGGSVQQATVEGPALQLRLLARPGGLSTPQRTARREHTSDDRHYAPHEPPGIAVCATSKRSFPLAAGGTRWQSLTGHFESTLTQQQQHTIGCWLMHYGTIAGDAPNGGDDGIRLLRQSLVCLQLPASERREYLEDSSLSLGHFKLCQTTVASPAVVRIVPSQSELLDRPVLAVPASARGVGNCSLVRVGMSG